MITAFPAETGLPLFLLDDHVIFDTDDTLKWFEERVIGQTAAVSLIVELLATVKAGGAEIIQVDKASFQNAMKPVYDKFITDAKLKGLVKRIQDTK